MSSTERSSASYHRWHRPRVYITIVAFYHIALSTLAILVPQFYRTDFISFLVIYYPILVLYALLGSLSAYLLLKSNPHFKLPMGLTVAVAATAGLSAAGRINDYYNYCTEGTVSMCETSISLVYPWAILFAVSLLATFVLLKGWVFLRQSQNVGV